MKSNQKTRCDECNLLDPCEDSACPNRKADDAVTLYALKFVREDKIDEHLALGWMGARPNAPHHHLTYGIEMKWVCPCAVPGGFSEPEKEIAA